MRWEARKRALAISRGFGRFIHQNAARRAGKVYPLADLGSLGQA